MTEKSIFGDVLGNSIAGNNRQWVEPAKPVVAPVSAPGHAGPDGRSGGAGGSWEVQAPGGYANDANVEVRALLYEPDPVLRRIGPPEGWLPSGEIDHAYISRQSMLNRHKRGLSDSVGAMRESMASDRGTFSNSAQARAYLERIDPPLKTFDLELMTLGAGGLVTRGAVNGAVALGNGVKAYGNALMQLGTDAARYGIGPALGLNWDAASRTTTALGEVLYAAGGVPTSTPFGAEASVAGAGVRRMPSTARTGAFDPALLNTPERVMWPGFGKLEGKQGYVSSAGLEKVQTHLDRFGQNDANSLMVQRLEQALGSNAPIKGADLAFYTHELNEATRTARLAKELHVSPSMAILST